MGFQCEPVSTELSLAICPGPVKTSSFKSVSTDLSLAIYPDDLNSPMGFQEKSASTDLSLAIYPDDLNSPMGFQEKSVSTDLSLAIGPDPVMTSSFTKKLSVDYLSMPFAFEKSPQQDSVEKTKRSRFATLQEEEDYYSQEIQNLHLRMMKNSCVVSETTNKATNICPLSSTKNDANMVMKKKRRIRGEVVGNEATRELRRFIMEEMNGVDMKLVIQKNMYVTDLNPAQNRLSMPINQLETHEFLKPDEKQLLASTQKENEIEVRLVGPTLQMYTRPMKLKLWRMKHSCNYVLITNWNRFVLDNREELKLGTKIQVWSFRKNQRLCFAIAIVGRPDDRNNAA